MSSLAGHWIGPRRRRTKKFNALLKGTYRISSRLSNVGRPAQLYFIEIITYDGNGHARMTERGTIIDSNNTLTFSFEETGILTYAVKRDGSFTQEASCTATDGSYRVTGVKWVGQIGAQGLVLILSGAIPPEPSIFTFGGVSSERLGGFTATAVRIRSE